MIHNVTSYYSTEVLLLYSILSLVQLKVVYSACTLKGNQFTVDNVAMNENKLLF